MPPPPPPLERLPARLSCIDPAAAAAGPGGAEGGLRECGVRQAEQRAAGEHETRRRAAEEAAARAAATAAAEAAAWGEAREAAGGEEGWGRLTAGVGIGDGLEAGLVRWSATTGAPLPARLVRSGPDRPRLRR